MFNTPYPFISLGEHCTLEADPVKRFQYKFQARHRKYLVTIELFSFGLAAIKYCDVKDKNDKKRAYRKIFNEGDSFRIITTCLFIMLDFWKKNPSISFAFYAVPREPDENILQKEFKSERRRQVFIQEYKRVRFKIYEYAMLNLSPPQNFIQTRDVNNSIYLLVNKAQRNVNSIVLQVAKYLYDNQNLIFELDIDTGN